jgi:hypothetical protein
MALVEDIMNCIPEPFFLNEKEEFLGFKALFMI